MDLSVFKKKRFLFAQAYVLLFISFEWKEQKRAEILTAFSWRSDKEIALGREQIKHVKILHNI